MNHSSKVTVPKCFSFTYSIEWFICWLLLLSKPHRFLSSFYFVVLFFEFFFHPQSQGLFYIYKFRLTPEYQSPKKKPGEKGAGKNHERLKKLLSLPEKEFAKERTLGGNVLTYRGSFKHEQYKVSSFLLYCDGAWPLSCDKSLQNFQGVEVSN